MEKLFSHITVCPRSLYSHMKLCLLIVCPILLAFNLGNNSRILHIQKIVVIITKKKFVCIIIFKLVVDCLEKAFHCFLGSIHC